MKIKIQKWKTTHHPYKVPLSEPTQRPLLQGHWNLYALVLKLMQEPPMQIYSHSSNIRIVLSWNSSEKSLVAFKKKF